MNSVAQPVFSSQAACPQCGALVPLTHRAVQFECPWCGSSLAAEGLRVHRLAERPRLTAAAARQALATWMSGPEVPHDLAGQGAARTRVGAMCSFPFLRVKGEGGDRWLPLAPLPSPDVLELASVPADLRPVSEGSGGVPEETGPVRRLPVQEETLRARLREASQDPQTREVYIEERVYFPVWYSYRGSHFSAVIDGSAGRLLAARRPARPRALGEPLLVVPAASLLAVAALFLPTLGGKLAGIAVTTVLLFFLLRWSLARYG